MKPEIHQILDLYEGLSTTDRQLVIRLLKASLPQGSESISGIEKALIDYQERLNLSNLDLADALDCHVNTISMIRQGIRKLPKKFHASAVDLIKGA